MSVYKAQKLKKNVNDMDKCTEIIILTHTMMVVSVHVHTIPIYQGCIQRGVTMTFPTLIFCYYITQITECVL